MPIYPYSFTMPPVNKQDIPSDGVAGEFLGISAGGVLDWLPVSGGSGSGDMLKADNLSGLTSYPTARTNLGLGTSDSPTFANLTLTSPSLSSSAPVTISQTWNAVGQTFKALVVNAAGSSGTNSAAGSLLADFQLGGVSKAYVDKEGAIYGTGTVSGGTFKSWMNASGYYQVDRTATGAIFGGYPGQFMVPASSFIGWNSAETIGGSVTTKLFQDAANTLALRNGALAQTFNVYGTYSSITDYKRLSLSCSASTGNATIGVPFNSVLAVTGGSSPSTTATITFATQAAAFPVGSSVVVAGVTPSGYNGTYVVTASTTSSVSYTVGGALAAWSSGGTATVSGSAALTLTGAGNLGIGTTAPSRLLTVVRSFSGPGNIALLSNTNSAGYSELAFDNDTPFAGEIGSFVFGYGGTTTTLSNTAYFFNRRSGPIFFGTSNAERMRIDAAGNVGIGTNSPTSKLHVVGDGLITGTVGIGDTGTSLKQFVIAGQAISNSLYLSAPQYIGLNAPNVALMNDGVRSAMWNRLTGITLTANSYYGFSPSDTDGGGVADTMLRRDGEPYHLATRNGTNGQKFSVYGTYPGANWERFTITAPTSGNVLLGTYKGTSGVARGLEFQTDGVTRMTLSASSHIVQFNSSCELLTALGTGAKFDFSFNGLQYSNISGLGVSWANNANASTSKHVGLFAYSTELGVVQVNDSTKDTFRDLRCRSVIQQLPITTTITPASNGDLVVEATSNTTLTFKLKGTDGTVRSGTITLA